MRAKGAVPLRSRNRVHCPKETFRKSQSDPTLLKRTVVSTAPSVSSVTDRDNGATRTNHLTIRSHYRIVGMTKSRSTCRERFELGVEANPFRATQGKPVTGANHPRRYLPGSPFPTDAKSLKGDRLELAGLLGQGDFRRKRSMDEAP